MAEQKLASGPGGFPELGDTVYNEDGSERGLITFFYAPIRENVWAVKLTDDSDDHEIELIERRITDGGRVLIRLVEKYQAVKMATVKIEEN